MNLRRRESDVRASGQERSRSSSAASSDGASTPESIDEGWSPSRESSATSVLELSTTTSSRTGPSQPKRRRRGHADDDPNRPQCPVCGKSFSRLEHMHRHALMHERPAEHVCGVCGKAFHRSDALQRHEIVHKRDRGRSSLNRSLDGQAARTHKACHRCWRMKLRCDESRPCKRCERAELQSECLERPHPGPRMSSDTLDGVDESVPQRSAMNPPRSPHDWIETDAVNPQLTMNNTTSGAQSISLHPATQSPQATMALVQPVPSTSVEATTAQPVARTSVSFLEPTHDLHPMVLSDGPSMWPDHTPFELVQSIAPTDVMDMTDLHWLFPSPLEPTSTARSHEVDSLFSSMGFPSLEAAMEVQHSSDSATAVTADAVGSEEVEGGNLLALLAGAATSPPAERYEDPGSTRVVNDLIIAPTPQLQRAIPLVSRFHPSAPGTPRTASISGRAEKRRRLEPQDLTAPSRRNSFSGGRPGGHPSSTVVAAAEPDRALWPDSWYPGDREKQRPRLRGIPVACINATPQMIAEQSTCQVPPLDEESVLALRSLMDLVPDDDPRAVAILKAINLDTYNMMLQLYFERFHPLYPFLSQANFETSTVHPLLLGACCAVGCTYAPMPHAHALAEFLADQVHLAINFSCQDNNLHARSLSIIQALLLVGVLFGSSGNKRLLEHAEYSRSALATMVRRCHLLEHHVSPQTTPTRDSTPATLEAHWRAWLSWESVKRTGWACVLADIELSASWKVPPIYGLDELRAELPVSNRHYECESARAWASFRPSSSDPPVATLASAYARLQSGLDAWQAREDSFAGAPLALEVIRPITTSLFHAKILAASLHLYAAALRGFNQQQLLRTDSDAALHHLHSLLTTACRAVIELSIGTTRSNDSGGKSGLAAVAFELIARFVQLGLFVDLTDLQSLAGRKGSTQASAAMTSLQDRVKKRPTEASDVAFACGRIVSLVRGNPSVVAYDNAFLFFASLYLYAFARLRPDQGPSGSASPAICLDAAAPVPFTAQATARYQLRFVGDLASASAPSRILKTHAKLLIEDLGERSHRLAKVLGTVLRDLGEQVEQECPTSISGVEAEASMA